MAPSPGSIITKGLSQPLQKMSFSPRFWPLAPYQSRCTMVWVFAQMTSSAAPLRWPAVTALPSTRSCLPHGFCPYFSNNCRVVLPPQNQPGLSSASRWEYSQGETSLRFLCGCLVLAWRAPVGSRSCQGKLSSSPVSLLYPFIIPNRLGPQKKKKKPKTTYRNLASGMGIPAEPSRNVRGAVTLWGRSSWSSSEEVEGMLCLPLPACSPLNPAALSPSQGRKEPVRSSGPSPACPSGQGGGWQPSTSGHAQLWWNSFSRACRKRPRNRARLGRTN